MSMWQNLHATRNTWISTKFDASTGSFVKTLFSENSDKWVEPEQPALFFKSRPGEFFWRSERDGNVHYYRYSTEGTLLGKATDGGVQTMSVIGLAGDIFYYTATADAGMDRTVKFTDLKTGKVGFVRSDKGTWNGFLDPAGKYMVCTFTDLNTPGGRTRRPYKGRAQYGQDRTATFRS